MTVCSDKIFVFFYKKEEKEKDDDDGRRWWGYWGAMGASIQMRKPRHLQDELLAEKKSKARRAQISPGTMEIVKSWSSHWSTGAAN